MFGKTINQIQETATDTLKPHVDRITTALYFVVTILVIIGLALVTR